MVSTSLSSDGMTVEERTTILDAESIASSSREGARSMRRLKRLIPAVLLSSCLGVSGQICFGEEEVSLVSGACTPPSIGECAPYTTAPHPQFVCPPNECDCVNADPFLFFDVDAIFWSRDSAGTNRLIVGGPEALSSGALGSEFESGVRLQGGAVFERFEVMFSWVNLDGWNNVRGGRFTNGVSFDSGINTTFAGANFIDNTTAFRAIAAAAEFNNGGGVDETTEHDGLGPVGAFADPGTTYSAYYRSTLQDFELMTKFARITSRLKFGVGWRHVDFDEWSGASLIGTFRAVNTALGANGGLSHTALTDPNGGNLTLISGAADGFDDETTLLGPAGPDRIQLQDQVSAQNKLNGVQFTMDALVFESERFLIDTVLKAGAYYNDAQGTFVETYSGIANDNSVYSRSLADTSNSVAFVGQITLGGMYRVNENLRFRAGWDVLFLSGIAMAPEQTILPSDTYTINNEGTAVINGGYFGAEFIY